MEQPKLPRIYLLRRDAASDELVQHALRLTPVQAILAVSSEDFKAVTDSPFLDGVPVNMTTEHWRPIVIVAEGFDHPLTAVNEDGSLEIVCPNPTRSSQL